MQHAKGQSKAKVSDCFLILTSCKTTPWNVTPVCTPFVFFFVINGKKWKMQQLVEHSCRLLDITRPLFAIKSVIACSFKQLKNVLIIMVPQFAGSTCCQQVAAKSVFPRTMGGRIGGSLLGIWVLRGFSQLETLKNSFDSFGSNLHAPT